MASLSIVRVGPNDNNLSAQLLRNAITSFFRKPSSDDNTGNENKDDDGISDPSFAVQNKYFNADIELKDIEEETADTAPKNVIEDGIILVFDAARSNPDGFDDSDRNSTAGVVGSGATFDSLQFAHQKALSNNSCGDLLRLCVGVSLSELSPSEIRGKDHEKEYSRRILWCLDNGYEYIEADLSESGKQKGHNDRDKDGFARIIEAIEGTVWSSASMSASKKNHLKESFADTKAKIQEPKGEDSLVAKECEETKTNEYVPPDPSLLKPNDQGDDTKTASDNTDVTKGFDAEKTAASMKEDMGSEDDQNTEKLFGQMESLLKEASQIRKNGNNLSDEERRERAGNTALALVNLMDQFGIDDSDEGSQGSGSDESEDN